MNKAKFLTSWDMCSIGVKQTTILKIETYVLHIGDLCKEEKQIRKVLGCDEVGWGYLFHIDAQVGLSFTVTYEQRPKEKRGAQGSLEWVPGEEAARP